MYPEEGQATLHTPEQWGGERDKAKPLLEETLAKYKTFIPPNDLSPARGAELAADLLSQCDQ